MLAKKLREPSKMADSAVRAVLLEQARKNYDGFFFRNSGGELRTLNTQEAEAQIKEIDLDNLISHFRFATMGAVTVENVHGWTMEEWTFLHNGSVSGYVDYTGQNTQRGRAARYSDSYLFFQDLLLTFIDKQPKKDRHIAKIITNLVDEKSFWGRAALYNNKTDKMYLFGDWELYTVGNSYLVISSASVDFTEAVDLKLNGFEIRIPEQIVMGTGSVEGVGVIDDFSKPTFKYHELIPFHEYRSYSSYSRSSYNFANSEYDPQTKTWGKKGSKKAQAKKDEKKEDEKAPVAASADTQQMVDSINQTKEENESNPAHIGEVLRNRFVGYDYYGNELYEDETGIHDIYNDCCEFGWCRGQNKRTWFKKPNLIVREEFPSCQRRLGFDTH